METIVQQNMLEVVKNICQRIEKGGLSDIDQFATDALELCKEGICNLITGLAKKLNEDLRKDKAFCRSLGLRMQEHNRKRTLVTEAGPIDFARDCYRDEGRNTYVYPLDIIFDITAYERVSANVSARLVEEAAELSYRKSAQVVTKGSLSKQTVKNKLQSVGTLEKSAPKEKRSAKELHLFADEDHVALQNGKNQIVPLITLCEGVREVAKGRNALKEPVHFSATSKKTKEAWGKVAGYISQAYEVDKIQKIYLHADGAPWIKEALNELSCSYVMDGFHFEKHLRQATAAFKKKNYRFLIREAVKEESFKKAAALIGEMLLEAQEPEQKKKLKDFERYLFNNWQPIVRRYTENITGSCTEALVSHIYSCRLSRNPMGWSEEGLAKMAELRVYTKNGCKVTASAFKRTHEDKQRSVLKEYGEQIIKEAAKKPKDWSIFEKERCNYAINTATQILIRSYGRLHGVAG